MKLKLRNSFLELDKQVHVMGILNVTPDSFSDGGAFVSPEVIIAHVREMIAAGADIIDVGGESSRPFSEPVGVAEELHRTLPVIKAIRDFSTIPISIDTTKAEVAQAAIAAGADIINDISALRFDPDMVSVIRDSGAPVVIMHMQGAPKTMQVQPAYEDLLGEIKAFLEERLSWAESQGIDRQRIIVDPGIGFGKTVANNLSILKHLAFFKSLGRPVLIGHSRKAFIGHILNRAVFDRDVATAAVSALCVKGGAAIIRVHDVDKTVQAVRMAEAILAAE